MNAHTSIRPLSLSWPPSTRKLDALIARADRAPQPKRATTPAHFAKLMPADSLSRRQALELLDTPDATFAVAAMIDAFAAMRAGHREEASDWIGVVEDEMRSMLPPAPSAADLRTAHIEMVQALRDDPDRGDYLRDLRDDC